MMLANLLDTMGVGRATAHRMIDGDLKETSTPLLEGRSPREAMQTLGTEWGRACIGTDLWLNAWRRACTVEIKQATAEGRPALIVIDDCRYPNELAAISEAGGRVFWISRPEADAAAATHQSEAGLTPADCGATLDNSGAIFALTAQIDRIVMGG